MKKFTKALAIILVMLYCFSTSSTVFAVETVETPDGVLVDLEQVARSNGIAGYRNYYHDGSGYYGEYTISTSSIWFPKKQYTVQTGDFNSGTLITIVIYNSKGQQMNPDGFVATGNGKWENKGMNSLLFSNGDTYTIRYNVFNSNGSPLSGDDGWIGIWIY